MRTREKYIVKRDSSIELARIFGCLIVIGVHTCLGPLVDEQYDFSRVFIASILADGVAIFWLITGCFYFNTDSYKKAICKMVKSIGVPLLVFSIFSFYFSAWVFYDVSFAQSLFHTKEEYINILKILLTWNNPVPCGSHLWYLYTHILLVLIFPVLKSFANYLEEIPEIRVRYFVIISFLFLVINDLVSNQLANFNLNSLGALLPASIEVIYGFILYKHKEIFCKKRYVFIAPIIFTVLNLIRSILQIKRYYIEPSNNSILFWFSSFGVVCAASIIVFCISINSCIKSQLIKKTICFIASFTFYIYIIHTYVIALMGKYGITDRISSFLLKYVQNAVFDFGYTFILIIIEFLITFFIAFLIKVLSNISNKVYLLILNIFTRSQA